MMIPDGLDVLYADQKIVVVNKPSGLLSVPGRGPDHQDCVVSRVREMFPESRRFPSVHRLDMDTSGLMVLALTARANHELCLQFQQREVSKRYTGLLDGLVAKEEGLIDLPLRMDMFNRPYQMYDPIHGKRALTEWRRLAIEDDRTRVEFVLHTGRTHQLRVHSAHPLGLGCPLVGDRLYGTGTGPGQLKLHASYLCFVHPKTKDVMEFVSKPKF